MIKENDFVGIKQSAQLSEMKLDGLIGLSGVIVETLLENERINKGCLIHFSKPFRDEYLWFIPLDSIIEKNETDQ